MRPADGYEFPPAVESAARPRRVSPHRVSQVPRLICRRPPSPLTPEGPAAASARCFTAGIRLHPIRRTGRPRSKCNEAETGSLALRLTPSSHGASTAGSPRQPPDRLHGERASSMVSSFQLTRPARLGLAHLITTNLH